MGQERTLEEIRSLVDTISTRWRREVMSIVIRRCLGTILFEQVEEIAQVVFQRLQTKLGQGDLPELTVENVNDDEMQGPILGWLKKTATFVRFEFFRRQKRIQDYQNNPPPVASEDTGEFDPMESILDEFSLERLQSAIHVLPPRMKAAISARLAGDSYSDISNRMGVTPKTVRAYVSRGAERLREHLRRLDQDS